MTVSDFTTRYREQVRALFAAREKLKSLAELAKAILAAMPDGPIGPIDPTTGRTIGSNADVTKADLVAAVQAAGELETHLTDYSVNPNEPTPTNVALQKLL
jgi:hypothetical protein